MSYVPPPAPASARATVTGCEGFNEPPPPVVTFSKEEIPTGVMTPVEIVSGPPDDEVPSEITVLGVPDRTRFPVVAAVRVQPVSKPPPSTSIGPIVVEKDDAEPSVPLMATDGGAVSDSVPAARLTARFESPHAPPPGGVHAYAGEAASGVATATAAPAAHRSLASDMDLSG